MLKYTVVIGKTTNNPGTAVDVNALEITLYKSEELDFGVFTIPATTRFENFQILDRVDITVTDGSNTKDYDPFIIIADEVTPVSKKGLFKHTVTFIEDIHKFEKILSGNVFITQPLTGQKKTLLDVMNHIKNVVPFERASVHSATRLFNIDSNLASFLNTIEAPQFFFSGMNLREMINAVASYVNGIGRMEDNRNLVFSFYNEILGLFDINEESIYKLLKNQTKYFTSSVESSIENATGADDEERAVIVHPNPDGFISMRSTDLKITDETFEFRLPYPIERIKKVEYKTRVRHNFYFEVTNFSDLANVESDPDWGNRTKQNTLYLVTSTGEYYYFNETGQTIIRDGVTYPNLSFVKAVVLDLQIIPHVGTPLVASPHYFEIFDVTRHIYELNNYKRLDIDVVSTGARRQQDLQSNTMHFQITGKTISNNRLFGLFDGANLIESFYLRVLRANGYVTNGIEPTFNETENSLRNNWDEQQYRITYVPYFGTRVRLNKDDVTDHPYNTQISINQGERIVSAERLLRNIYGMAQRLGQDEIEFKRYYTDLSEMFELGQITEDGFVIASKQITYYINYYMVNYMLSKNFNRFANRIALNQENRPFDIGLGTKTTNRNLLYNEYVEIDTQPSQNTSLLRQLGIAVFLNTLRPTSVSTWDKPVQYGIFGGAELADTLSSEGVLLHPIAFSEGNSLNFYWSFEDTIRAGDQSILTTYSKPSTFLGIPFSDTDVLVYANKLVRYTDNNEALETFELSFGNELPNLEATDLPVVPIPSDSLTLIGGHSINGEFNDNFIVKKDKSEILSMNYVLSVVPNYKYNNKIIVGRELVFSNNLIIANKGANFVVYTSETETYNSLENRYVKGDSTNHTYTVSFVGDSGILTATIPNIENLASWALGDDEGNLYVGVNVDGDLTNTLYFNFRNKRENISYTFDDIDVIGVVAPRNLLLTADETSILAEWEDDQNSDFYELGIRTIAPFVQIGFINQPPTTNTFLNFTGLTEGFTYQIRLRSVKNNIESFYITQNATTSVVPEKIENFDLIRASGATSLTAVWTPVLKVTGYLAQARLASRSWEIGPLLEQTLGSNQTATSFGVGVNNILVGRVQGFNDFGSGDFSDEDMEVRPLVTGRGASALSDTRIRASWDPLANLFEPTINQEIGFEISRKQFEEVVSGTTTGIGSTTSISDSTKSFTPNAFVGKIVFIVDGPRAGEFSTITSNTNTVINFDPPIPSVAGDLQGVDYDVIEDANLTTQVEETLHTSQFFEFTGLTAETYHRIEIRAYYEYIDANFGKKVFSDTETFFAKTLEVSLPADVVAPILSDRAGFPTSSQLSWNVFNPNAFTVRVSTAFAQNQIADAYELGAPVFLDPNETLVINFPGLSSNETKTLFAQFRVGNDPFVFSTISSRSQTTLAPPPPPVPTGVGVSNITSNSVLVSWNAVTSATNGFDVLLNPDNLTFFAPSGSTSFTITGLVPATFYSVQVRSRSVNFSGPSAYSTPAVEFNTLSGPPGTPTTATFSKVSNFNWSLSWSSVPTATGYDYQLSTSSNFSSGTIEINVTNTPSTSASGTTATGVRYYARVRARNSAGVSNWKLADPTGGIIMGPDGEL